MVHHQRSTAQDFSMALAETMVVAVMMMMVMMMMMMRHLRKRLQGLPQESLWHGHRQLLLSLPLPIPAVLLAAASWCPGEVGSQQRHGKHWRQTGQMLWVAELKQRPHGAAPTGLRGQRQFPRCPC